MDKKFFVASHALIENKDKFLIIQRSEKESYMPLVWDIPGGSVEFGETTEETLMREISEEVAI